MADKYLQYLTCPIRQVISKFGDKWSLLVLYQLNQEGQEVMRFSDLHHEMADCSQKMLSKTLKNLEKNHLISRKVYPQVPPKVEYCLTDVGRSLIPSVQGLVDWAIENFERVVTD